MKSVMAGRPIPLKNPSTEYSAMPSGAPSIRGNQYSSARFSVDDGMPNGVKMLRPLSASRTNTGTVNSDAQSAVQVAWEARAKRRAPYDCATRV